jgi:hypothetical protein
MWLRLVCRRTYQKYRLHLVSLCRRTYWKYVVLHRSPRPSDSLCSFTSGFVHRHHRPLVPIRGVHTRVDRGQLWRWVFPSLADAQLWGSPLAAAAKHVRLLARLFACAVRRSNPTKKNVCAGSQFACTRTNQMLVYDHSARRHRVPNVHTLTRLSMTPPTSCPQVCRTGL